MPPLSRKLIHKLRIRSGVWAIRGIADRSLSPYQFPWRVSIFELIRRTRKSPVMTKCLETLNQGVFQPKRNGYSIAELLIALSIFVGVLAGVWGTYTMISEEANVRKVIADVQLLQRAAQRYKREHGKYTQHMDLEYLQPYLGSTNSGLRNGINYRGSAINIMPRPWGTTQNLGVRYYMGGDAERGVKTCELVLKHFGTETQPGQGGLGLIITPGKAIKGFVSDPADSLYAGCDSGSFLGLTFE